MKNINQLEKQRKEVLMNMNQEEIISYFDNISKNQVKTFPKLTKKGISDFNSKEYVRLEKLNDESVKILNSKYHYIEALSFISKYEELLKLYEETINSGNVLFLERILFLLYHYIKTIEKDLNLLQEHLTLYYMRYFFKFSDVIDLLEIAKVPEKTIKKVSDVLIPEDSKEDNSELYITPIEETYNIFIESIVKDLEETIEKFREFKQIEENPVEKLSSKGYSEEFIETYNFIYNICCYGNLLIDIYEDLKLNPFEEGNKLIIAEHLSIIFNENISDLTSFEESLTDEEDIKFVTLFKDRFSSDVPKYDFKEFKLILPF